ncbi:MAG: hypothetical protein JW893_09345, partial [Candidatus Omnitrophica bacterium]|nr:hypothetical protein [Candidatus Omnitrophota bacterium]
MKPVRRRSRVCIYLAGVLSLFFLLGIPSGYSEIQQWDFQLPEDYQYDQQKIEIKEGTACLLEKTPYRDEKSDLFDRGAFLQNTWAVKDSVELRPNVLEEERGLNLPLPLGGYESGLAALWHMNEPSGTNILDSVARNVAKASDAEIVSGQTGFGYARLFDGEKSHIFIPHYRELNFRGPFSIEAWIRPIATKNDSPQTIISRWQSVAAQKSFALQLSSEGKIDFQVSSDGALSIHHTGDTVLTPGVWYHVAAVYTGSDIRVYLNGALDGEPALFQGPLHQSTVPIYVGALVNNRVDEFYEGVIDEVAFYQRALSETEALTHYGNASGLVGLWHLNERAGVLADRSGYGHNAIAHGNPVLGAEGKFDKAVYLDGKGQYLDTAASYRLNPEDELTLEAWIKPEASAQGTERQSTILSSIGGETGFNLSITGPEGQLRAFAPSLAPSELLSRSTVMPNIWQHVAVTWSKGTVRLYLNGVLETSAPYHGFLKTGKVGLRIGMDSSKVAPFRGAIDEVSVYRRAKTEPEIAASAGLLPGEGVYLSSVKDAGSVSPWKSISWGELLPYGDPIAGHERGLIHLYHFDESGDAVLNDNRGGIGLNVLGTYLVPGIFSKARWFSEKGKDKLITQRPLPSLSTFTISFWFQFSSSEPGLSDRLFSIGDGNPTVYRSAPDGKIHVSSAGARKIISRSEVRDTRWHHLTLTSDGRHLFLYLDGQAENHTPFVMATAAEPLVIGNLKTSDTFQGALDEFAVLNYAVERETLFRWFLMGKMDLKFLARTANDDSFKDSPWKGPHGASWMEREARATTVGLWHLNERRYVGRFSEVTDASRVGNHGTAYGNVRASEDGVLWGAAYFNGSSDFVEIPDAGNLHLSQQFTLSAWIRPSEIEEEGARIVDKNFLSGAPIFSSFSLELIRGNRLGLRVGRPGGYHLVTTDKDGEIGVNKWNHVAATYDGEKIKLFINGVLRKVSRFQDSIPFDEGSLYLGKYGGGESGYYHGALDEVVIENQALADGEVLGLFLNADPENFYRSSALEALDIQPGRYFQYQTHFSTDYPIFGPILNWVEIRGSLYAGERPSITNLISVSFADIGHFREKVGPEHRGALTYQISNDGSNWFYHNGRHWVVASGVTESNTADQIETRIRDFPKDVGIGSFYFRAFFYSPSGMEPVELEGLEVDYLPNKLTMVSPNGEEAWLIGSEQVVRWNSAGQVDKIRIEYSHDGFKKDFRTIAQEIPNTGSYSWLIPNEPDTQVKLRVMDALDPRVYDLSDVAFRLIGAFEVVSPNWNERWQVGSTQEIVWRTLGNIKEVRLAYSFDEFQEAVFPIVDSVKNEGLWKWEIPDHISPNVKIRVSDVKDPLVYDQSNDTFAIIGSISVLAPEPHTRWLVGSDQEIRWANVGTIPTVKLEYATEVDGETPQWKVLENVLSNRGSYVWQVPDEIGANTWVRVSDPNDDKVFSMTGPFAIVGGIRLLNPTGEENWTVGSRRKIAWETIGTIPNVNLEYATLDETMYRKMRKDFDGVAHEIEWNLIEEALPNIGSHIWE